MCSTMIRTNIIEISNGECVKETKTRPTIKKNPANATNVSERRKKIPHIEAGFSWSLVQQIGYNTNL